MTSTPSVNGKSNKISESDLFSLHKSKVGLFTRFNGPFKRVWFLWSCSILEPDCAENFDLDLAWPRGNITLLSILLSLDLEPGQMIVPDQWETSCLLLFPKMKQRTNLGRSRSPQPWSDPCRVPSSPLEWRSPLEKADSTESSAPSVLPVTLQRFGLNQLQINANKTKEPSGF